MASRCVAVQFEKEVSRCLKVMEELEAIIARKKGVSQQVGVPLWFTFCWAHDDPPFLHMWRVWTYWNV